MNIIAELCAVMTSLSDRPPIYVSQCEMPQSFNQFNPGVFGGKWDGQLLLEKQTRILKTTNSCIRCICRQTTYVEKAGD